MLSKKAQLFGQIFIYIIAIVLFSLILIYGYSAIRELKEKSEKITYIKFKTELKSVVRSISPDYGTLKRKIFFIGGDYKEVCFVQTYNKDKDYIVISNTIKNPIINDSFRSNVTENVFLTSGDGVIVDSFYVGPIDVTGHYLCARARNGKIKVQFEGMGDHATISTY